MLLPHACRYDAEQSRKKCRARGRSHHDVEATIRVTEANESNVGRTGLVVFEESF
jgi:hypothetical protein